MTHLYMAALTIEGIITKITKEIINPTIYLLFAAATVVFVWGIVQYMYAAGEGQAQKGKNVMFYGIIGLFVMASAYGIVKIMCDFFGTGC